MKFKDFISKNSLSIVLIILFVGFLIAQYFTGYATYDRIQDI